MPLVLHEPQWLRLATLLVEDFAAPRLAEWEARAVTDPPAPRSQRRFERVHDIHSLVDSCWLEGDQSIDAVMDLAALARAQRPWPEAEGIHTLGVTEILLAQRATSEPDDNKNNEALVQRVLGALAGGSAGSLEGGRWAKGVDLWRGEDPAVLVVLTDRADPQAEERAGRLVWGTLRLIELARHKIDDQDHLFREQVRPRLKDADARLEILLAQWMDQLQAAARSLDVDDPDRLQNAWCTRAEATQVVFELRGLVKTAELARSAIQANHANLRALLARRSPSPARRALLDRPRRGDLALAQIDTTLAAARATSEQVEWTGTLHQSRLRTALYRLEQEENQLRERGNRRLVFLGLAIGVLQVWTGVAALLPDRDRQGSTSLATMLGALVLVLGVLGVTWWVGENSGRQGHERR